MQLLKNLRTTDLMTAKFDPTLWVIAWDGNEVAGFSINRFRMGIGWIGTLGSAAPGAKRDLGSLCFNIPLANFTSAA